MVAAICIATAAAAEEVGRVGLEGSRGVEGGKKRELVVGVRLYIYWVRNGSAPSDLGSSLWCRPSDLGGGWLTCGAACGLCGSGSEVREGTTSLCFLGLFCPTYLLLQINSTPVICIKLH